MIAEQPLPEPETSPPALNNPHGGEHSPLYNIKAVSRLVGLLPVTLRAWERRYGLPQPRRGEQGYRLYSEYDLRILRWLIRQVESGLSIGRAVRYLEELRRSGQDPATNAAPSLTGSVMPSSKIHSTACENLGAELLDAMVHFDEPTAMEVIRRAFALYPVDQVLINIFAPMMVQIGEMWHTGHLPIATEHFASQWVIQQLMSMLAATGLPSRPGLIVAACAPGETHQIGLLMLVVILRWRGWNVRYLGPDLSLERLEEALAPIHPTLLMFSANRPETARNLEGIEKILRRFPQPSPLVVVGGAAFDHFRLAESVPVIYLNTPPEETISTLENLLMQYAPSSHSVQRSTSSSDRPRRKNHV
ncbi:MAG TPA: MerR family DNA-binding transcriptional regulator [Anaerolinea thermolimosa]|uniref:MerR family DNA-binding transcriptional regulator n=1 Tax=Anaerolinea thermolimosa TaxID=229919 RepID=A0A3D1JE83_9CHLR|nr:MerR family transcriptional regulator [Anaerolinea thermolimosa]GAP07328.1 predicted cobalamin binding protein [Anaerolinea thermolimosa]HCE16889.1 MerR family DNA-binding transcriptional regulator [Anaerolinea thermolimosa]